MRTGLYPSTATITHNGFCHSTKTIMLTNCCHFLEIILIPLQQFFFTKKANHFNCFGDCWIGGFNIDCLKRPIASYGAYSSYIFSCCLDKLKWGCTVSGSNGGVNQNYFSKQDKNIKSICSLFSIMNSILLNVLIFISFLLKPLYESHMMNIDD